jgi:hypothetical protein
MKFKCYKRKRYVEYKTEFENLSGKLCFLASEIEAIEQEKIAA